MSNIAGLRAHWAVLHGRSLNRKLLTTRMQVADTDPPLDKTPLSLEDRDDQPPLQSGGRALTCQAADTTACNLWILPSPPALHIFT